MNYSPYPQSFYVKGTKPEVLKNKISLGLGDPDFIDSEALWNYAVITSKLPFMWEDKEVKDKEKPVLFTHLKLAISDLDKFVGEETVRKIVTIYSPKEALAKFKSNFIGHLDMARFHGGQENLRIIMTARVAAAVGCKEEHDEAILEMVKRQI